MSNDYTVQVRVTLRLSQTIKADSLEDAVLAGKDLAGKPTNWLAKEHKALRRGVTLDDHEYNLMRVEVDDGEWP